MPNLSEVPVGSWLRQVASGAGITGQPNGVHSLFLTPTFRLPQFGVLVMMTNRRYYLLCDLRSQNRLTRTATRPNFKSSGCLYSAWAHCLPVHSGLNRRTRLLSCPPPAASTSSPLTTSSWETTMVSCLCRWIAPVMLRIWQPTPVTRTAPRQRECNSAPRSGASPTSTSTSRPDKLAETSGSGSTRARLVGPSTSDLHMPRAQP